MPNVFVDASMEKISPYVLVWFRKCSFAEKLRLVQPRRVSNKTEDVTFEYADQHETVYP